MCMIEIAHANNCPIVAYACNRYIKTMRRDLSNNDQAVTMVWRRVPWSKNGIGVAAVLEEQFLFFGTVGRHWSGRPGKFPPDTTN